MPRLYEDEEAEQALSENDLKSLIDQLYDTTICKTTNRLAIAITAENVLKSLTDVFLWMHDIEVKSMLSKPEQEADFLKDMRAFIRISMGRVQLLIKQEFAKMPKVSDTEMLH